MSDAKVRSSTPLNKRFAVVVGFQDPRVYKLMAQVRTERHMTMSEYGYQAIVKSLRDDLGITKQSDFLALLRSIKVEDLAA
jgi:hypothetical protein